MFLPIIQSANGKKRSVMDWFGGINVMASGEENEFEELKNMMPKRDNSIESIGEIAVVKENIPGNSFLPVMEAEALQVYSLADDGFYKNGTKMHYFGDNTYFSASKFVDQTGAEIIPFQVVSSKDSKLIKAGDDLIIASPQMLFCTKDGFFKPELNWYFCVPLHYFTWGNGRFTLATVDTLQGTYFSKLTGGEKFSVELYEASYNTQTKICTREALKAQTQGTYTKCIKSHDHYEVYFDLENASTFYSLPSYCVIVLKRVLDMSFQDVIYAYNRLWGVKGNRIYASCVGNVFDFANEENDPLKGYWADTQSSGEDFTAINQTGSRISAFKPNATYEIYGTIPPYTIKTVEQSYGCTSARSIGGVAGVVMLQNKDGIYAYGGRKYVKADYHIENLIDNTEHLCGAGINHLYYVSYRDRIFMYDYYRAVWGSMAIEDGKEARYITSYNGALLCLGEDNKLRLLAGPLPEGFEVIASNTVEWELITRNFGQDGYTLRGITQLQLRMKSMGEASFTVAISCDNKPFKQISEQSSISGMSYYTIPITIHRCNEWKLKIGGTGKVNITSFELIQYTGGAVKSGGVS